MKRSLRRVVLNAPLLLALSAGLCGCAGRSPSDLSGASAAEGTEHAPFTSALQDRAPAAGVEEIIIEPVPLPEMRDVPGTGILSLEREEREVRPRVTRLRPEDSSLLPEQSRREALPLQAMTPVDSSSSVTPQTEASVNTIPQYAEEAAPSFLSVPRQETVLAVPDVYSLSPHARLLRAPNPRPSTVHYAKPRPAPAVPDTSVDWAGIIQEAGEIFGVDPALLRAVIRTESAFNRHAESGAGAQGAMQVMPATQEALGLIDPFDARANVYAGAQYLMHMLKQFSTVELALAAYNAGPGAVKKYGGIPPYAETRAYVRRVMKYWQEEQHITP